MFYTVLIECPTSSSATSYRSKKAANAAVAAWNERHAWMVELGMSNDEIAARIITTTEDHGPFQA